jgi:fibro-slime domain-containing protein
VPLREPPAPLFFAEEQTMHRHPCRNAALAFSVLSSVLVAAAVAAPPLEPGLVGEYFALEGELADFPDLPTGLKPTLVRVDRQVNFVEGAFAATKLSSNFYARWTGALKVEKPGRYTLGTRSDDGSRLFINNKLVVDNGGLHATTKRTGTVDLDAGTHDLRLEFFQAGGGASCELLWIPPGAEGGERLIPASSLLHAKGAEKIAWDEAAWKKMKAPAGEGDAPRKASGAWAVMDCGPFLSATVGAAKPTGNVANKGIAIKLGEGDAGMLFDTDLVRMAAGWTGGFLKLQGVAFDGAHGPHPQAAGEIRFGTSQTPGWARPGTKDFGDPRTEPFGPLPRQWSRYRGLYCTAGMWCCRTRSAKPQSLKLQTS